MSTFQVANCIVALGGDTGNTVPKTNVTAAEIAVLQTIHGGDAVKEIVPTREIPANHRAERERLLMTYRAKDGENRPIVDRMFPGAAARVFERLDELQLTADQFKRGHVPEWLDKPVAADDAVVDSASQEYLAALNGAAPAGDLDELDGEDEFADDSGAAAGAVAGTETEPVAPALAPKPARGKAKATTLD